MSKLQINLHQDFQPASLTRRNLQVFTKEPLPSGLSFLLSAVAALAGLLLVYLLV